MTPEQQDWFDAHRPYAQQEAARLARIWPRLREELQAAALVGLWRAVVTWDGTRGSLGAWVRQRARACCIDWLRGWQGTRDSDRRRVHTVPLASDPPAPSRGEPALDVSDALDALTAGLDSRRGQVVRSLREGCNYREASARLGCCPSRVSQVMPLILEYARERARDLQLMED